MNASPTEFRRASSCSDRTRISKPSRKESSPKSSSPVCATAVASRSSPAVTRPRPLAGFSRQYTVTTVAGSSRGSENNEVAVARRGYDSPLRRQKAAQTRDRIVRAGSELAHGYASWDWQGLTFRAVAERAGVGERTVYRHFPTERHLHDAVMQRLEEEAGITYEDVELANVAEVTARVFATRRLFAVAGSVGAPDDPTFVAVDERRRHALLRAVSASTPHWSDTEQETGGCAPRRAVEPPLLRAAGRRVEPPRARTPPAPSPGSWASWCRR